MPRRSLLLVVGLLFASAAWAADSWPQWRGLNRDGISPEKGLLDHWDDAPPLVWKAEGLGTGYSGTVIDNGFVCTLGDVDGKTYVILLKESDGQEIWRTEIGEARADAYGAGARSTPTIDGDRIYGATCHGVLACLKTGTGEIVWKKSYKEDFEGRHSQRGYTESPLIDGDKLICSPGGPEAGVVALDKRTGAEIWRCALTLHKKRKQKLEISYSSPIISHGGGVKQYIRYYGGGLAGIEAETGKQLWNYGGIDNWDDTISTPLIRGDYLFASSAYGGGSALLKLVPTEDGGVEPQEIYNFLANELQIHHGGAVLVGDYVYLGHGGLGQRNNVPKCMEFLTGEMKWNDVSGPGGGSTTIAYADGHLYFFWENGTMALIAATPNEYQVKGQFKVPGPSKQCWAYPAISNGRLYVRNADTIYCYDLKK